MSDEPQVEYQPDAEPGQVSEEPVGEQPQYVTEEVLRNLLSESESRLSRQFQSLTDKSKSQVDKQLGKWQEVLQAQGIAVSKDMLDNKRQELAIAQADRAIEDGEYSAQEFTPPPIDRDKVDSVNLKMAKLQVDYGFVPNAADPEFKGLNWNDPDPDRFYSAYEARVKKMAQRLGKTVAPSAPMPGNPAARVGAPSGTPAGDRLQTNTEELERLQKISNPTREQIARRKELLAEITLQLPHQ